MNVKQTNRDKMYEYSSLSSFFFSLSCVSSAIAMYSCELRQWLLMQMLLITEIVQIRKCRALEIDH